MQTRGRASFEQYSQNVLDLLESGQQLTRTQIASHIGVSRTAIIPVLTELQRIGAVVTLTTRQPAGRGRPAEVLAIDSTAVKYIGVDITHVGVVVVLANSLGEEIAGGEMKLPTGATWESRCATGINLIHQVAQEAHVHLRQLKSMAIGLPASASWHLDFTQESYPAILPSRSELKAQARIQIMENVSNDTHLRMKDLFAAEFGVPVYMDHHIRYAAIAEASNYADAKNLLYVRLSSGVGGAVIASGEALAGATKLAGEIGHMCVDHSESAPKCRCGKTGCLEAFVSIEALESAWHDAGYPGESFMDLRRAAQTPKNDFTAGELFEECDEPGVFESKRSDQPGEELPDKCGSRTTRANRIVARAARYVGRVIGYTAIVTDPDLIVISGEVGDLLLTQRDVIQKAIDGEILPVARNSVCGASLGSRAGALGAVLASMKETQEK